MGAIDFLTELKGAEPYKYDIGDYAAIRKATEDGVMAAVRQRFPVENERYALSVADLGYVGDEEYSLAKQKEALLKGRSLGRRLKGRWQLTDKATGEPVARTGRLTLMSVPHMTQRGTYIRNGHEMTIGHIMRLRPGVYARSRADGRYEAHINPKPGTGGMLRVEMDPGIGAFQLQKGTLNVPLYPLLRMMGTTDEELGGVWGHELLAANKRRSAGADLKIARLIQRKQEEGQPPQAVDGAALKEYFAKIQLDPETTLDTMGQAYGHVTPQLLAAASGRLLRIARGEARPDNRDSMRYQKVYGPADLFAERVLKDGGGVLNKMLWKATNKGNLDFVGSGVLDKYPSGVFNESRLARYVEGSNPFDAADNATQLTRVGEGGIGSTTVASAGMRSVQPSFQGYVDPVRTPESFMVGLVDYMAQGVRKGSDGLLYSKMWNPRTQKHEWVDSRTAANSNIATSDYMGSKDPYIPVARGDRGVGIVKATEVDYILDNPDSMFSTGANLVPMKSGVKGMRLTMGSKYLSQSLPLVAREAPLVRTAKPGGGSQEADAGGMLGAVFAQAPGRVRQVRKDRILVDYADGTQGSLELYDNFPFNRKGYMRSIPQVKAGDNFKKGQALASSNYTDAEGVAAGGANLRTAFINYRGLNFEDAIVISESAARKLTSESMLQSSLEKARNISTDPKKYLGIYPGRFTAEQIKKIGPDGRALSGTVLEQGDPLILGVRENEPAPGTLGRRTFNDMAQVWEHPYPGVVTDSETGRQEHKVFVRANIPMQVGDKMSNRQGAKGVVALVLPDTRMPADKAGRPFDVLMSPLGVVSRTNPAMLLELAYGKIAEHTGKPMAMPSFTEDDYVDKALKDLAHYGLSDVEDVTDTESGRGIPAVATGNAYYYKLKHTAETKEGGRGEGDYTMDELPARGSYTGSKRLGGLEVSGLVGHSAMKVLEDAKLIRGQSNDTFWRDFRMGLTPTMPGRPMVHDKLFAHLKGAGINVRDNKEGYSLFGMTAPEVSELTGGREVRTDDTFDHKSYRPMDGGLFGKDIFGPAGDQWGYIPLEEPLPNPAMADSLRRILDMSLKDYEAVAEGRQELEGLTGGAALRAALGKIDLDDAIRDAMGRLTRASGSARDGLVKRYRALASMKLQGHKPSDFIFDRVPVLPPRFRPVTSAGGLTMVADANFLYKELFNTNKDLAEARGVLPEESLREMRTRLYKDYKALAGLHDPEPAKLQQQNVGGLLKWVFGKGSPKYGALQRRITGIAVDTVGRGMITPNPALKLNQVGLPEEQAWSVYEPFVVRELVGEGYKSTDAVKMTAARHPAAYAALQKSVGQRPVILTRAPVLHKFGLMGFWPVLTKGNTVQLSPSIVVPFNADFDSDVMNFHVPVSRAAAQEVAAKMMPEQNLLDIKDFKAHYKPMREYLQGLHLATGEPRGPVQKVFNSREDAVKAYRKGEIDINTPIRVVEKG